MSPLSEHAGALPGGAAGEARTDTTSSNPRPSSDDAESTRGRARTDGSRRTHPFRNEGGPFWEAPNALADVIAEYGLWLDYNFGPTTDATRSTKAHEQFLGLVEEVGELAHSILKAVQGIRGTPEEHEAKQRDACADAFFFLIGFCHRKGWDLEELLVETWAEVRERDWITHPRTGKAEQQ